MKITVLGWLAILAVITGVLLILKKQAPATILNQSEEGTENGQDQNLGA